MHCISDLSSVYQKNADQQPVPACALHLPHGLSHILCLGPSDMLNKCPEPFHFNNISVEKQILRDIQTEDIFQFRLIVAGITIFCVRT